MTDRTRDLYRSDNGDRWRLVRDDTGRVFVRHEANLSSGGAVTDIPLAEFLRGGMGPEQQELIRLIGSLVDRSPERPA